MGLALIEAAARESEIARQAYHRPPGNGWVQQRCLGRMIWIPPPTPAEMQAYKERQSADAPPARNPGPGYQPLHSVQRDPPPMPKVEGAGRAAAFERDCLHEASKRHAQIDRERVIDAVKHVLSPPFETMTVEEAADAIAARVKETRQSSAEVDPHAITSARKLPEREITAQLQATIASVISKHFEKKWGTHEAY